MLLHPSHWEDQSGAATDGKADINQAEESEYWRVGARWERSAKGTKIEDSFNQQGEC